MKFIPRPWLDFLFRHPVLNFLMMGACFVLFGFTSVNLFVLLKANIDLFLQYGLMVIEDGALEQLVDLVGSAYLSVLFLVLFKVGERVLVETLTDERFGMKKAPPSSPAAPRRGARSKDNARSDR
jgi:hypothetical protein